MYDPFFQEPFFSEEISDPLGLGHVHVLAARAVGKASMHVFSPYGRSQSGSLPARKREVGNACKIPTVSTIRSDSQLCSAGQGG